MLMFVTTIVSIFAHVGTSNQMDNYNNNIMTILFNIFITLGSSLYGRIDRTNGPNPEIGSTFHVLQGSQIVFNCFCRYVDLKSDL